VAVLAFPLKGALRIQLERQWEGFRCVNPASACLDGCSPEGRTRQPEKVASPAARARSVVWRDTEDGGCGDFLMSMRHGGYDEARDYSAFAVRGVVPGGL
jgi:hypothetical protein